MMGNLRLHDGGIVGTRTARPLAHELRTANGRPYADATALRSPIKKKKKMSFVEVVILALGLSMDAFAVAVCLGLGAEKATLKRMFVVGLYFGVFQAVMPLIGYFAASLFADRVTSVAPWIAFALLLFLGVKMIWGGFRKDKEEESSLRCAESCTAGKKTKSALRPKEMLPYAFATSIDALAVGVTFAFLSVSIVPAVLLIGGITLALSMAGVKLGNLFGLKFKSYAVFAGGAVLILIGAKILLEHLGVIGF